MKASLAIFNSIAAVAEGDTTEGLTTQHSFLEGVLRSSSSCVVSDSNRTWTSLQMFDKQRILGCCCATGIKFMQVNGVSIEGDSESK